MKAIIVNDDKSLAWSEVEELRELFVLSPI